MTNLRVAYMKLSASYQQSNANRASAYYRNPVDFFEHESTPTAD